MTTTKKHAIKSLPAKSAGRRRPDHGAEVFQTMTPRSRDEVFASVLREIRAMTPEEGFKSLVRAGIYTREGELRPEYGGPPLSQSNIRKEWRSLIRRIRKHFPKAEIRPDVPIKPIAPHWIDIKLGDKKISVEWRPRKGKYRKKGKHGFGFFADDNVGYGEGPNMICVSVPAAFKRICDCLK